MNGNSASVSVYTRITTAQLQRFLQYYDLGALIDFSGIENGVENTNYRLHTDRGQFILTLFEELADTQIEPIFALLSHLRRRGLSVPHPKPTEKARHCSNSMIKAQPCSAVFQVSL
nr:phosphotransferase [Methylomarinum sp. Ch1-1]MDP4522449.1 phosphotransferase [Methylomarinum sp. Ch1-1]